MNRRLTTLMLPLIGLFLVVIGLVQVQKVWKHIVVGLAVAGAAIGWVVYFNLISQSLW